MSDTPRTDTEVKQDEMDHVDTDFGPFAPSNTVSADFARDLERELAKMEDQRDAAIWCHEKCREDRLRVIEQRDRLAEALREIKNELGVPQPEYPAPVANAVKIADVALAAVKGGTP